MKYIAGFILGVITTILVLMLFSGSISDNTMTGLTMLPDKGGCISKRDLKIFQTINTNVALGVCRD